MIYQGGSPTLTAARRDGGYGYSWFAPCCWARSLAQSKIHSRARSLLSLTSQARTATPRVSIGEFEAGESYFSTVSYATVLPIS